VARLRSESSDIDTAEVFLSQLVAEAPDPVSQSEYQAALDEIDIERRARHLDRARKAYYKLNGRDVDSVWDLTKGTHAVLDQIPTPWPASLPAAMVSPEYEWELDSERDRFVSTYYGHRYELTFHPGDRKKIESWKQSAASDSDPVAGSDSDSEATSSDEHSQNETDARG
jgi:hypothetical protein